jgi:hypothetical protein
MEQILKKSKISLPEVEIRELVPDRNRKSAPPAQLTSPEPEAESSRQRETRDEKGTIQHRVKSE